MGSDLHAAVRDRLRRVGQRYTSGRRDLVDALVAESRPVTTADLVAAHPAMPQSTTYHNLAVLTLAGVVHRVAGSDDWSRYELAEALTGRHHHHLMCRQCGAVEDFAVTPRVERTLASLVTTVGSRTGFRIEDHRLDLLGTCAACEPPSR
jgi:Fur family transcriptional regulator, ferric uptake regulator